MVRFSGNFVERPSVSSHNKRRNLEEQKCYIRFDFFDEENFKKLSNVYDLIKSAKNNSLPETDEFWLKVFPDSVLKKFYFSENDIKPDFETKKIDDIVWHFYSLIESLVVNCDLKYLNLYKISDSQAQLDFYPYGYPYGGISAMVVLIKSFDCLPRTTDDGTGIYRIDFMKDGSFEINDVRSRKKVKSNFIFIFIKKLFLKK